MLILEYKTTPEVIYKLREIVRQCPGSGQKKEIIEGLKKEMDTELKQKKSWFKKGQND